MKIKFNNFSQIIVDQFNAQDVLEIDTEQEGKHREFMNRAE